MSTPGREGTIRGTFTDAQYADFAAEAARRTGFRAERRPGGVVDVETDDHPHHAEEVRAILAAYGAREYTQAEVPDKAAAGEQRARAEDGASIELVEERLRTRTHPVQTGEVEIRKEVVSETRTIEVPIRREELVIERHPVTRRPADTSRITGDDPLIAQLVDRLHHLRDGESLRIPIIEEEVIIHKRPVVVEEITVGKRALHERQSVSERIRREQAHIEPHGDASTHDR